MATGFLDGTGTKGIQDSLRESEFFFKESQRAAKIGSYKCDFVTGFWVSSEVLDSIFGIGPDYVRNIAGWLDLVHPADREMMSRHLMGEVLGRRQPFAREYRVIRRDDGQVRWVNGLGEASFAADGTPLSLIGTIQDITARRQAEDALRDSEARFRSLTEGSPDCILRFDRQGRHAYANPAALALVGLEEAQVLGRTHRELGFDAGLCAEWEARIAEVLRTGRPVRFEGRREAPGGTQHFEASLTPERVGDGPVRTLLAVTRDTTEARRAEEERRALSAQLQQAQKLDSLGSLAGGVAHDMNNVLGAILGMATSHQERHPPESATHKAFASIAKAAQRGAGTLRSLLGFARQSPAEERDLDLNAVLREEATLLERTTLARVRLVLDLDPELPGMRGDGSALSHAFMNLCVNAVDAMPEGGTLTLRTRADGPGWLEAAVEDTGCGMPPETLQRALDPFFTTKPEGKGTGLGLSMVYSAVKAHQGRLDIDSAPGQGTRVRVRFPVAAPRPPAPEAPPEGRPRPAGRALAVLVVDDDELIQETFQAVLEALGHAATQAFRGEEALAMLEAGFQPDAVILDMNMPGLGGRGTLPALRALRPRVPVLLATGRADQAAMDLARAHPGVHLLGKPFTKRELQEILARVTQA